MTSVTALTQARSCFNCGCTVHILTSSTHWFTCSAHILLSNRSMSWVSMYDKKYDGQMTNDMLWFTIKITLTHYYKSSQSLLLRDIILSTITYIQDEDRYRIRISMREWRMTHWLDDDANLGWLSVHSVGVGWNGLI